MLGAKCVNKYTAECWKPCADCLGAGTPHACPHKTLAWREEFYNLVVTQGLNKLLDGVFTSDESDAMFIGLKGTGTVNAADTLASHAGWAEITAYTGNRQAYTPNAAASAGAISNSSAKGEFAITGSATVFGAFLATAASGSSGDLYGAGDFSSSRAVVNGDTLNVQVDVSITG